MATGLDLSESNKSTTKYGSFEVSKEGESSTKKLWGKIKDSKGSLVLLVIAELLMVPHSVFWVAHYIRFVGTSTADSYGNQSAVLSRSGDNHNHRSVSSANTMLCLWAFCIGFLDSMEYVQFAFGYVLGNNPRSKSNINFAVCRRCHRTFNSFLSWCSVYGTVVVLAVFGFAKVGLAITMESQSPTMDWTYFVYCALEPFHIIFAVALRTYMLMVLFKIRKVWEINPTINSQYNNFLPSSSGSTCAKELFKKERLEYRQRGEKAQQLMYPFTVWFLTPWLTYLATVKVNPNFLLSPWTESASTVSQFFHLVNTAYKTLLLLLQYVFALKINQYHRDYYLQMNAKMVFKFENGGKQQEMAEAFKQEYFAEASQLTSAVTLHDDYNFYPTFLSINPRIAVDGPLYILFLLLDVFVNISDKLFYTD